MRFAPIVLLAAAGCLHAGEADAEAVLSSLRGRHLPYGMVADPVFDGPESDQVIVYTHCGDSAIWTGHLLAAESFRYAVTRSDDAMVGVLYALDGIRKLIDVTGNDLLARCAFPSDSPYATSWISEESQHGHYSGIVDGQAWTWIGDTSRDQYLGVFFGLTAAWNAVDDARVRGGVAALATRLLRNLDDHGWAVTMPDGRLSTSFGARADQRLMMLKLGRRVNPGKFETRYKWGAPFLAPGVAAPIAFEVLEPHDSYFKFNLDHIVFYGLLTGGDSSWLEANYRNGFALLRRTTDDHGNAFFDAVELAVNGPNAARDERIALLLDAWLTRPRRDFGVDLRGEREACGENQACHAIEVPLRVTTDFLWQRSPFQLYGGGSGRIEGAGIDYLLPYWMVRYCLGAAGDGWSGR
ncbi:MAG: hypothetical protein R2729_01340 [Bryobacteraceae bacterium]